MRDQLTNNFVDLVTFIRRYSYFVFPAISLLIILFINYFNFVTVEIDSDLRNNIVNVSGVLSGFLFTACGIFISLPDNNFIIYLKKSNYFTIVYKVLLLGIIFLISSMILGIFKLYDKFMIVIFLCGMTEVIISVYYFYKITSLSAKSN